MHLSARKQTRPDGCDSRPQAGEGPSWPCTHMRHRPYFPPSQSWDASLVEIETLTLTWPCLHFGPDPELVPPAVFHSALDCFRALPKWQGAQESLHLNRLPCPQPCSSSRTTTRLHLKASTGKSWAREGLPGTLFLSDGGDRTHALQDPPPVFIFT